MLMKHETSKTTGNMKKQYNKRNEQFTPYKNYSSHPASENIHINMKRIFISNHQTTERKCSLTPHMAAQQRTNKLHNKTMQKNKKQKPTPVKIRR